MRPRTMADMVIRSPGERANSIASLNRSSAEGRSRKSARAIAFAPCPSTKARFICSSIVGGSTG